MLNFLLNKRTFFILSFLFFSALVTQETFSQEKNRDLKEPNKKDTKKTLNKKVSNKPSSKFQTRITTKVPKREISKKSPSLKGNKKLKLRKYGGSYSLKTWRKRKNDVAKNNQQMSGYRVKMAYTSQRKKRRNAQKVSSFTGSIRIKQQKPRGSKKSWTRSQARKPVMYNKKNLKKGTKKVKKSDLPNYQKYKTKKIGYNTKESEWMQYGGGDVKTRKNGDKQRTKKLKQDGKITY